MPSVTLKPFRIPANMAHHDPVLLEEILEAMRVPLSRVSGRPARYLDGTFGGGGHTRGLLDLQPGVEVIALDRDPDAASRAETLAEAYGERFRFVDFNFAELSRLEAQGFDGALFDLGVSSFQLDAGTRGFSFRSDAPLDMRMDPRRGISAAEFLETAGEDEITEAVRNYGEEPSWRKVVRVIIENRGTGTLQNTSTFAALIEATLGIRYYQGRPQRTHPATRTFQGIRIAVNRELEALEMMLPVAFEKLNPGGVLAVISFHSLEDRIVKRFMRRMAGRPEHGRDSRPQDERAVRGVLVQTKPIRPSEHEATTNPRSRSARLRIIEKMN